MASGTGRGNAGLGVIRIGGAVVVLHVARGTVRAGQIEVSVEVALRTLQRGVCPGQRKSHQAVIESRRLPGAGRVASLAGLRQVQPHMAGVGRLAEIRQVASHAIRGRAFEFSSDVASCAADCGVHPSQRKISVLQMIEVHSKPVVEAVALFAGGGETGGHVAGAGGCLVVLRVAGVALRGHGGKFAQRSILVAGIAIHGSVRAQQRKPVGVPLNLLD